MTVRSRVRVAALPREDLPRSISWVLTQVHRLRAAVPSHWRIDYARPRSDPPDVFAGTVNDAPALVKAAAPKASASTPPADRRVVTVPDLEHILKMIASSTRNHIREKIATATAPLEKQIGELASGIVQLKSGDRGSA